MHLTKNEIEPIPTAIAKVTALRPVAWHWKDNRAGTNTQYGFIAQEVEKLFPNMVSDGVWLDGNTRKFLAPFDLVPYLVVAIKEQQKQIDELKQAILQED